MGVATILGSCYPVVMMKETTKRSVTLVVAASAFVAAVIVASGCQTVKGLGEDIHYAGEKTEEAIKK